ncbi:MAG: cyclic nucleotide-binding domain-containing protein [Chloroflexi bacterium]|nr:cyclic nucleotide-binding domain-containing protein [Chloroflexota bacterium]
MVVQDVTTYDEGKKMDADKTATIKILKECHVFSGLNEIELKKVANLTEEKEYPAGATIYQEGAQAEELAVLQEGKVALQMSLSAPGDRTTGRITVDIVGRNELFGWSAMVDPHVYTLTSVCLQRCKVLSIDGIKLRSLLGANHHIGYQVFSEMVKVVASRLDDTRRVLVSERLLLLNANNSK